MNIEMNEQERNEYLLCSNPEYFIETYVKLQNHIHGIIPFKLREYQRSLLYAMDNNHKLMAELPRQYGKTSIAAGYLLWLALFKPHQVILVIGSHYNSAVEILKQIMFMYEQLPIFKDAIKHQTKTSIIFSNGNKILSCALTPNVARGLVVNTVYIDEYDFIDPKISKNSWNNLSTVHASKVILISTKSGNQTIFSDMWNASNNSLISKLYNKIMNIRGTEFTTFKFA